MPRLTTMIAVVCVLLIPVVASADCTPLDPVTTFTNGMLLPSATPLRSHNVYYQCDPDRIGCCGGRYVTPCLNSLLYPDHCCTGARPAPADAYGPHDAAGPIMNVEPVRFQQLGSVPVPRINLGPGAGGVAPAGGLLSR